jgi:hypothetical protein
VADDWVCKISASFNLNLLTCYRGILEEQVQFRRDMNPKSRPFRFRLGSHDDFKEINVSLKMIRQSCSYDSDVLYLNPEMVSTATVQRFVQMISPGLRTTLPVFDYRFWTGLPAPIVIKSVAGLRARHDQKNRRPIIESAHIQWTPDAILELYLLARILQCHTVCDILIDILNSDIRHHDLAMIPLPPRHVEVTWRGFEFVRLDVPVNILEFNPKYLNEMFRLDDGNGLNFWIDVLLSKKSDGSNKIQEHSRKINRGNGVEKAKGSGSWDDSLRKWMWKRTFAQERSYLDDRIGDAYCARYHHHRGYPCYRAKY